MFFFVRWFVGRFGRAVGTDTLFAKFWLELGLARLGNVRAFVRWHLSILARLQNFLHNLFCSKQCRTNLRLVLRAY